MELKIKKLFKLLEKFKTNDIKKIGLDRAFYRSTPNVSNYQNNVLLSCPKKAMDKSFIWYEHVRKK